MTLVPALANNLPTLYDHGANDRIGLDVASATLGQRQCPAHQGKIVWRHGGAPVCLSGDGHSIARRAQAET
jgi:hypothetical protein